MNVIKKFLVECGYEEEFLESTDLKFDEPKLIALVAKWQHQPSLRKFVEFAARYHLTPYSGNRECLLFKLEVSGSAVRNTLIGGFNGNKQEFELAGIRLNPEKVNPALSSFSNWQLATDELVLLAQQLDVIFDENEKPTPKYFWVKMSRPDIDNVLDKLLGKWLDSVNGSDSGTSVSLQDYFLDVFESRGGNDGEWVGEYRNYNQLSAKEKASDEQAIKELWTKGSTWVASIKNGIMSGDDYRKSEPDLIKFTRMLIEGTSTELYQQSIELLNSLLNEGKISRRYWATTNRVFASLHPSELSTTVAEDALRKVYQYLDARFYLRLNHPSSLNWYGLNKELLNTIQPLLKDIMDTDVINVTLWYIYESLNTTNPVDNFEVREPASEYGKKVMKSPLNQILYGPPGTGKTFHTIQASVIAAEPSFTWTSRAELKAEYNRLVIEQRIRFVTFHQSYGYEEFVEGLKAEMTEDNQIDYKVKPGIFKQLCTGNSPVEPSIPLSISTISSDINLNGKVWKISLEGTKANVTKTYCLAQNIAAIGWGDTGDLSTNIHNDYYNDLGTNDVKTLSYFVDEMKLGDLILCVDSKTSVEAVGVVSGGYNFIEAGIPSRLDYQHQRSVNWLAKDFSVDFKALNGDTAFDLKTCTPLSRLSVESALIHLAQHGVDFDHIEFKVEEPQSHDVTEELGNNVLIIDEINRGNISKIFGELITLIEPSKRQGEEEALEVVLPYSGDTFSVPNNLHIIGTMNTADRSLAMMDTALRRRFDFVEMMPMPELFNNREVKGIDLTKLLQTLNNRIEVLYDREHMLGHAFLFPVFDEQDEELAFTQLQDAFKNKIIPLLEEYFYEDWNKIRLVLGDNQKSAEINLIARTEQAYSDIFGSNHDLETYEDKKVTYKLKSFKPGSVWHFPEAYQAIYDSSVKVPAELKKKLTNEES